MTWVVYYKVNNTKKYIEDIPNKPILFKSKKKAMDYAKCWYTDKEVSYEKIICVCEICGKPLFSEPQVFVTVKGTACEECFNDIKKDTKGRTQGNETNTREYIDNLLDKFFGALESKDIITVKSNDSILKALENEELPFKHEELFELLYLLASHLWSMKCKESYLEQAKNNLMIKE